VKEFTMPNILIVYGTSYGHTAKVVGRMADVLERQGCSVDVFRGDRLPEAFAVTGYQGFVVAASVIGGKHQRYVAEFVRRHSSDLSAVPSCFVSVSGSAQDSPERARECAGVFLRQTSWRPTRVHCISGAIVYTRYTWPLRLMMKWIIRSHGGPTDTSRDYELTDWAAVEQAARQLACAVASVSHPPSPMRPGARSKLDQYIVV
jgi:menaquinone-dependent protoporphyrinogen oxidase